ncbi:MAG: hypothetical protein NC420_10375 [Eubacterium sp.]|nr:hypothetical protein [Eubacterium sp.]MCM1213163.1 hypothetical protein [Lachnospiraceae bacterium]MCM1303761.1 hypothetical protein [Butyrivibrio sp.]MCM1344599.1 hypothetical protein [Muribaculaceae bacterium]MCM1239467.1 hypothetical protein [Lachnospiraceae bacterium]
MEDLLVFAVVCLVFLCMLWWIVIFIGKRIRRAGGKCPQDGICRDAGCRWKFWCGKHR